MRGLLLFAALALAVPAGAQDMGKFHKGPVFEDYGAHADVPGIAKASPDTEFAIAFDASQAAEEGKLNRTFESAARFINMHVAQGVPEDNIRIAIVVHGQAVQDLLAPAGWAAHGHKGTNPNADLVQQLLDHNVRFIVCGQSAVAQDIAQEQLIEGTEMALSAMTAFALLQQRGYTVNP